jgi:hypothetical protein
MTIQRGSVVMLDGHAYAVIASRFGVAWLEGGPWAWLRTAPARNCLVVPGMFRASTPWEVN